MRDASPPLLTPNSEVRSEKRKGKKSFLLFGCLEGRKEGKGEEERKFAALAPHLRKGKRCSRRKKTFAAVR